MGRRDVPCVAYENIDTPETVRSLPDQLGAEGLISEVTWKSLNGDTLALEEPGQVLGIGLLLGMIVDGYLGALASKGNDDGPPDARVTTRHEHLEALETATALVAALATVGRVLEVPLEDREAGRWEGEFEVFEAVDRVDQLDVGVIVYLPVSNGLIIGRIGYLTLRDLASHGCKFGDGICSMKCW